MRWVAGRHSEGAHCVKSGCSALSVSEFQFEQFTLGDELLDCAQSSSPAINNPLDRRSSLVDEDYPIVMGRP